MTNCRFFGFPDCGETKVYDFYYCFAARVTESLLVGGVEFGDEIRFEVGDIQLIRLSLISHIKRGFDFELMLCEPFHLHLAFCSGEECCKAGVKFLAVSFGCVLKCPQHRLRIILDNIGEEHAVGREQPAVRGDKHCLNAEVFC